MTREQWVKHYGSLAKKVTAGTGIYPEVLLSQAIIESSKNGIPGDSLLAKQYNNYHGIKDYPKWKGKTVNLQTREVFDGKSTTVPGSFVVYDSIEAGFNGYVRFLQDNPRYEKAGVFSARSATEQIQRLKEAGYATDPQYVTVVNSVAMNVKKWLDAIPGSSSGVTLILALVALFF